MKFLIITFYDSYVIEADDMSDAVERSYNNHTEFNHIQAVVKLPEDGE